MCSNHIRTQIIFSEVHLNIIDIILDYSVAAPGGTGGTSPPKPGKFAKDGNSPRLSKQ